ncbi:hypothetical protein GCM10010116_10640 [Microbispora rosea subsp. aerata]|nr:SSI family serine proteinase inhibitor [Microbispora rosea]GGO05458.1 hypothetical protein GCM10010116_10640 [Microbispora rosea subsp. aerata]GIH57250.1 hypothetical protein Mro02_41640 [Microbispora rosea subsp. aerata]GLJ83391.1 hypothetical protein GCM10017588_21190 [Microbispora rosea subsp. aerata]
MSLAAAAPASATSAREDTTPVREDATPARRDASSARGGTSPAREGTLPAPPPPEIAAKRALPANRVRAVILTVANGEQAEPPARSVFLNCAPVGGSHPSPEKACALLSSANLDPGSLRVNPTEPCTMIYAPVTVTASGIWDGKYFQFRRTYGNDCEKRSAAGALFNF